MVKKRSDFTDEEYTKLSDKCKEVLSQNIHLCMPSLKTEEYEEGKKYGFKEGFKEGYEEGRSKGFKVGYDAGRADRLSRTGTFDLIKETNK